MCEHVSAFWPVQTDNLAPGNFGAGKQVTPSNATRHQASSRTHAPAHTPTQLQGEGASIKVRPVYSAGAAQCCCQGPRTGVPCQCCDLCCQGHASWQFTLCPLCTAAVCASRCCARVRWRVVPACGCHWRVASPLRPARCATTSWTVVRGRPAALPNARRCVTCLCHCLSFASDVVWRRVRARAAPTCACLLAQPPARAMLPAAFVSWAHARSAVPHPPTRAHACL